MRYKIKLDTSSMLSPLQILLHEKSMRRAAEKYLKNIDFPYAYAKHWNETGETCSHEGKIFVSKFSSETIRISRSYEYIPEYLRW